MWISSTGGPRHWRLLGLLSLAVAGCSSTPLLPSSATPARGQPGLPVAAATCAPCGEQTREVERLRMELATRDLEVAELRSNQRVQVKVLQESKREVTRAKVKVRRLATKPDAASYIAEVEVALASQRASTGGKSSDPRIAQAQRLLESTDAPFAQGDYGVAMDRAAEAEQLIMAVADVHTQRPSPTRAKMASHRRDKAPPKTTVAATPRVRQAPTRVATSRIAPDCDRRASLHREPGPPGQALPRDPRPLLDCRRLPG